MRPIRILEIGVLCAVALGGHSCSVVRDVSRSIASLSRCTFKLVNVADISVAGVNLTGKTSLTVLDGLTMAAAFGKGALPASFTLNVAAINPNDGTAGTTKSSAVLAGLAWRLFLDDTQTIAGDIAAPVTIPASGEQVIIPLRMNLDLVRFFNDRGYDHIVGLALALGGVKGSASRVTLRATPTVRTDFGTMAYPGEIAIIDKEFRGQ